MVPEMSPTKRAASPAPPATTPEARPGSGGLPWQLVVLVAALLGLAVGGCLWLLGLARVGHWVWVGTTLIVLVPTALAAVRSLLRRQLGVDLIAVLAMGATLALEEFSPGPSSP